MINLVMVPNGRTGNILFQLSYINYLERNYPNLRVYLPEINDFGIAETPGYRKLIMSKPDLNFSIESLNSELLNSITSTDKSLTIHFSAWGMNSQIYIDSRDYLRGLLPQDAHNNGFEKDESQGRALMFHIRGGDIWQNNIFRSQKYIHSDYQAIPVSFYQKIAHNFAGEIQFVVEAKTPPWYLRMISKKLDIDIKVSKNSAIHDLRRLAGGGEIGLGVSTFSWMAAFIGTPSKVHMPILGIFDVKKRPDLDFNCPEWKISRYEFEPHAWTGNKRDKNWLESAECSLLD
jgi:hypothetical protein